MSADHEGSTKLNPVQITEGEFVLNRTCLCIGDGRAYRFS